MNLEDFNKAEAQLHVTCQMISLTGINFVNKKADDSHSTAKWLIDKKLIAGREFEIENQSYQVFVDPLNFALGIMSGEKEINRIKLDKLNYMQTLEPWKKWIKDAGYNGELNLELHYDLPDNDLYKFSAFSKPSEDVLQKWAELRTLANNSLSQLTQFIGLSSDINIWPHHFDTGTYYELHKTEGNVDKSIGSGLAVTDTMVGEPYFYIYAWCKDVDIDYSDTPELNKGKWLIDNWKGAVLPISSLGSNSEDVLAEFFERTSTYLKSKLL